MTITRNKLSLMAMVGFILAFSLLLGGCSDVRPIDSNPGSVESSSAVKVTYNYSDSGQVQLSDNNITLAVGQKLILEPAPGLSKKTRFMSSGENFFNDVMAQESSADSTKLTFVAKKPGKGKLQIIPNYTETNRAVDFWVNVK